MGDGRVRRDALGVMRWAGCVGRNGLGTIVAGWARRRDGIEDRVRDEFGADLIIEKMTGTEKRLTIKEY
jgi:hypothetical protein